jgi:NADPH-dependent ferric siderophore reductase
MTTQQEPQAARPQRPRPVIREIEVAGVERVTPHMVRVSLTGHGLQDFTLPGPAGHIRLFLPRPGEDVPSIPERDADGRFPEGTPRPLSRVYTPRRWDDATKRLDVDIVLHEGTDGPGSTWARGVAVGKKLMMTGPSGRPYVADPEAEWYVIAGDHAGLPAVATILENLPAGKRADVYVEVPDASDELELLSAATLNVTWVHGGYEAPGEALASAIKTAALPEGNGRVFVACEAGAMREIKRNLLLDRKLNRDHVYTHGYWQRGTENHPDHDIAPEI